MTGPPTKQPGPRLPSRKPGKVSAHTRSYSNHTKMQAAAVEHAAVVTDIAERFLSALWRALNDCPAPADAAGVELPIEAVPAEPLRNVARIIGGCAEVGVAPTPELILSAARDPELCIVHRGGDERAGLLAILGRESTSAGLANYAKILAHAHRKRVQAARLWRRLRDIIGDQAETRADPVATTSAPVRAKARAGRRVVTRGVA